MAHDYRLLREAAAGGAGPGRWTDDTPVPPKFFGPLWPEGPPPGWPGVDEALAEAEGTDARGDEAGQRANSDAPPLTVYLDPGEAPQELITEFYLALDALYRAYGGSGLEIAKEERRLLVGEEV